LADLVAQSLNEYTQSPELCEFAKEAAAQEASGHAHNFLAAVYNIDSYYRALK